MIDNRLKFCPLCGKHKEQAKGFCDACEATESESKKYYTMAIGNSITNGLLAHYSSYRTIKQM